METNPTCADRSVTPILLEYEDFWVMPENITVARMIEIVLLISVH